MPIELSPAARRDVTDILRYTNKTWGQQQLAVYRGKIESALLAHSVGSHVIIYRFQGNSIGVVRILHARMSIGGRIRE